MAPSIPRTAPNPGISSIQHEERQWKFQIRFGPRKLYTNKHRGQDQVSFDSILNGRISLRVMFTFPKLLGIACPIENIEGKNTKTRRKFIIIPTDFV